MMSWYCLYMLCSSYTCIWIENYEKRVVVVKYLFKKFLNKEKKERVNYQFLQNYLHFS